MGGESDTTTASDLSGTGGWLVGGGVGILTTAATSTLFGILLGAVFAATVDLRDRSVDSPIYRDDITPPRTTRPSRSLGYSKQ